VPASTSNLGAGFDCLGLALPRYLTADFNPDPDVRLRVERRGTLRPLDDRPDSHDLFVRVFRRTLELLHAPAPAGALTLDSEIPIGRGLGSSAAAVVGAIGLAAGAAGIAASADMVLRHAQEHEHHLDNVAPACLGGLVGVARDDQGAAHAFPLPLSPGLGFAFAAPGIEVETQRARAALPKRVPFGDAVHNIAAMGALVHALATGDRMLLEIGLDDRLHVRHRLPLIPGADAAIAAARSAGAWGATVSGSGSGLLAFAEPRAAGAVADAMAAAFRRAAGPHGVVSFAVDRAAGGLSSG